MAAFRNEIAWEVQVRSRELVVQSSPAPKITLKRAAEILERARRARILVVGDLMLDQFVWGGVRRISPEAPVPVVEFERESFMPGGAANVARNLSSLDLKPELFGPIGPDQAGRMLKLLLAEQGVDCTGTVVCSRGVTSLKTRIIAHQQQLVRLDRECIEAVPNFTQKRLLQRIISRLDGADAVIFGDYGKGAITQHLLDTVRGLCQRSGIWVSLDPKPVHQLNLSGLSLMTPNRKEAFELAGLTDGSRSGSPLQDAPLLEVAAKLSARYAPKVMLITLGDQGMLLCEAGRDPVHIPTVAREVFDVSGAGDTVIAAFTLCMAGGATPIEAAVLANHAAGVVVGKLGTATVTQAELLGCLAADLPRSQGPARP